MAIIAWVATDPSVGQNRDSVYVRTVAHRYADLSSRSQNNSRPTRWWWRSQACCHA